MVEVEDMSEQSLKNFMERKFETEFIDTKIEPEDYWRQFKYQLPSGGWAELDADGDLSKQIIEDSVKILWSNRNSRQLYGFVDDDDEIIILRKKD